MAIILSRDNTFAYFRLAPVFHVFFFFFFFRSSVQSDIIMAVHNEIQYSTIGT